MRKISGIIQKLKKSLVFLGLNVAVLYVYTYKSPYPSFVFNETVGGVAKQFASYQLSIANYFDLVNQNEKLKQENERLRNLLPYNYVIDYVDSTERNAYKLLLPDFEIQTPHIRFDKKYEWIQTNVLQKINRAGNIFWILNAGDKEGIKESMPIVGHYGAIGQIIKVYSTYSIASTLHSAQFSLSVKVTKNGSSGIIQWDPTSLYKLQLSEIPTQDSIHIGDTVYSSHLSYIFPPNIPIGTVYKINTMDQDHYKASVVPIERLSNVYNVYIVKQLSTLNYEEGLNNQRLQ